MGRFQMQWKWSGSNTKANNANGRSLRTSSMASRKHLRPKSVVKIGLLEALTTVKKYEPPAIRQRRYSGTRTLLQIRKVGAVGRVGAALGAHHVLARSNGGLRRLRPPYADWLREASARPRATLNRATISNSCAVASTGIGLERGPAASVDSINDTNLHITRSTARS